MTPSCCVLSSPAAFLGLAAHSEDVKMYFHFTKDIVRNSLPLLSTTTNQPTNQPTNQQLTIKTTTTPPQQQQDGDVL